METDGRLYLDPSFEYSIEVPDYIEMLSPSGQPWGAIEGKFVEYDYDSRGHVVRVRVAADAQFRWYPWARIFEGQS